MKRSLLLCVLILAVLAPQSAFASTESRDYRALPTFETTGQAVVCRGGIHEDIPTVPDGDDIGGACFGVSGTTVDITVDDDYADDVFVIYAFQQSGMTFTSGSFCNSISNVTVPSNATALLVTPTTEDAVDTTTTCPGAESPTKGTITVDFA